MLAKVERRSCIEVTIETNKIAQSRKSVILNLLELTTFQKLKWGAYQDNIHATGVDGIDDSPPCVDGTKVVV